MPGKETCDAPVLRAQTAALGRSLSNAPRPPCAPTPEPAVTAYPGAPATAACVPAALLRALTRVHNAFCLADPRLPDCPIVHASAAYLQLTGHAPDEVLGRNWRVGKTQHISSHHFSSFPPSHISPLSLPPRPRRLSQPLFARPRHRPGGGEAAARRNRVRQADNRAAAQLPQAARRGGAGALLELGARQPRARRNRRGGARFRHTRLLLTFVFLLIRMIVRALSPRPGAVHWRAGGRHRHRGGGGGGGRCRRRKGCVLRRGGRRLHRPDGRRGRRARRGAGPQVRRCVLCVGCGLCYYLPFPHHICAQG